MPNDLNFMDPSQVRPDLSNMPGAQGYFAGMQMGDYKNAVAMKQLSDLLQANTYVKDEPVRASQREADISKNDLATMLARAKQNDPNYAPTMIAGEEGTAQSQAASGQEALGTVQGKIESTNTANAIQSLGNRVRQLQILSSQSPMMAEAGWKQMYQTLPPALQQALPPSWTPDMPKRIDNMYQSYVNSPEYIRQQGLERIKGQEAYRRTQAEQAGATQRNKDTLEAARTPEQILNWGRGQLRKVTDPAQRESIENQIDSANEAITEEALSKQFGKLDQVQILLGHMNARQQAIDSGATPEQAAKAASEATQEWLKLRQQEKNRMLMSRGVTMSYLRRKNPGADDKAIRDFATKNNIKIIE